MNHSFLIIAIDGPSGSGKSTAGKGLADRLGLRYIDTGAMYRAFALKAHRQKIEPTDQDGIARLCEKFNVSFVERDKSVRVFCNGEDVTEEIRGHIISGLASAFSANKIMRETLVKAQREMGNPSCETERGRNGEGEKRRNGETARDEGRKIRTPNSELRTPKYRGAVFDGRDIGTKVFPDAPIKFFIIASSEERAKRRHRELNERGEKLTFNEVKASIEKRDNDDGSREHSPLKMAEDSIIIDTTDISIGEMIDKMEEIANQIIHSVHNLEVIGHR